MLDNACLVSYWIVPFGAVNFSRWFREVGRDLEYDVAIVEEYQVRDNDYSHEITRLLKPWKLFKRAIPTWNSFATLAMCQIFLISYLGSLVFGLLTNHIIRM